MSIKDAKEFYDLAENNSEIQENIKKINSRYSHDEINALGLPGLIKEEVLPIAKNINLYFTAEEFIDVLYKSLRRIHQNQLEQVSGGVSSWGKKNSIVAALGITSIATALGAAGWLSHDRLNPQIIGEQSGLRIMEDKDLKEEKGLTGLVNQFSKNGNKTTKSPPQTNQVEVSQKSEKDVPSGVNSNNVTINATNVNANNVTNSKVYVPPDKANILTNVQPSSTLKTEISKQDTQNEKFDPTATVVPSDKFAGSLGKPRKEQLEGFLNQPSNNGVERVENLLKRQESQGSRASLQAKDLDTYRRLQQLLRKYIQKTRTIKKNMPQYKVLSASILEIYDALNTLKNVKDEDLDKATEKTEKIIKEKNTLLNKTEENEKRLKAKEPSIGYQKQIDELYKNENVNIDEGEKI